MPALLIPQSAPERQADASAAAVVRARLVLDGRCLRGSLLQDYIAGASAAVAAAAAPWAAATRQPTDDDTRRQEGVAQEFFAKLPLYGCAQAGLAHERSGNSSAMPALTLPSSVACPSCAGFRARSSTPSRLCRGAGRHGGWMSQYARPMRPAMWGLSALPRAVAEKTARFGAAITTLAMEPLSQTFGLQRAGGGAVMSLRRLVALEAAVLRSKADAVLLSLGARAATMLTWADHGVLAARCGAGRAGGSG